MTVTFDLQSGRNLAEEKPEDKPEIDERLEKLNFKWQELEAASKLKGQKLGDAKKQEEFNSGVKSIEGWITELETMNVSTEKATDLTTATRLYQKHKVGAAANERCSRVPLLVLEFFPVTLDAKVKGFATRPVQKSHESYTRQRDGHAEGLRAEVPRTSSSCSCSCSCLE